MGTGRSFGEAMLKSQLGAGNKGWYFIHGKLAFIPTSGAGPAQVPLAKQQGKGAWKNNLYGDGHAESRRAKISSFTPDGSAFTNTNPGPDEVQPRWGNASGYQMW